MGIVQEIFKAYDIRGKYPRELNEETARHIGNAVAVFLSQKYKRKALTLLVASDFRLSSPSLKRALIEGITMQGSAVIDIGEASTPLFYFALNHSKNDGGVMVTASHNPPEYNGFKVRGRLNAPIAEATGLTVIHRIAARNRLALGKTLGKIVEKRIFADPYIAKCVKGLTIGRARVVVDAAGGAAAVVLPKALSRFSNVMYKPLFFTPDGSFKDHDANPLKPEAQKYVKDALAAGGFDFGALFDGDGDRIVFFDEAGNEIRGDFMTAIFAEEFLRKHPKRWIVADTNTSWAVMEYIAARGGKVVRAKRGYVNIMPVMQKKDAVVGGEISDHFYFRDFSYCESGVYALLKILEIVSRGPKKLSHYVRPLQKYFGSPEINFEVKDKRKALHAVERRFSPGGNVFRNDGITVEFPRWWFNLRPSNTEPLVRLTLEAKTKPLFEEKQKELFEFIKGIR